MARLRRRRFHGEKGDIVGTHTRKFRGPSSLVRSRLDPKPQTLDLNNILVALGEDFVLKLYRRVEAGPSPDREMGEFLTNNAEFSHVAPLLGAIEYRVPQDEADDIITLGTLTSASRNTVDGWTYTLDHLGLFFERALATGESDPRLNDLKSGTPLELAYEPVPALMSELLGGHSESAVLLGRRT